MAKSGLNVNWIKSNITSKEQFAEVFEAHAGNIDLNAEYDKIFPPKEKAPAKTEAKEPEKGK